MSAEAKSEGNHLLALETGASLASISPWTDETWNRTTAPGHCINLPRDSCAYDAERDCPDGQCVVGAINKQLVVLASNASDERRLNVLKKVVHFFADAHQPLHAGYRDDWWREQVQATSVRTRDEPARAAGQQAD